MVQVPGNSPSLRPERNLMLQSTQDMQCVENCDDPDQKRHVLYEQPVWQTLQMFRTSYPCPPFFTPQYTPCHV